MNLTDIFKPTLLTGPILEKEMRVASRRRRNYVLRLGYIALLMLLVVLFWAAVNRGMSGNPLHLSYELPRMGKAITMVLVWFAFIVSHLIAIVLLSTSVSDEIYKRTLGVLMTTSVSSLQIVMGKLLSKLLQIALLLAILLPVLAIVRVFGGVSWDYVIHSAAVTGCSVLFCSSLTLLLSIFSRRAYWVILLTLIALGVLFLLLPLAFAAFCDDVLNLSERVWVPILGYINPPVMMLLLTDRMDDPSGSAMMMSVKPWIHYAVMVGASAACLLVAMVFVRRAALRQAVGDGGSRRREKLAGRQAVQELRTQPGVATIVAGIPAVQGAPIPIRPHEDRTIRRVGDWPVLWKEIRAPLFDGKWKVIGAVLFALALLASYACVGRDLADGGVQAAYVCILTIFATLCTAIVAATSITSEREARSWEVLLASGVGDWQIVLGKFSGAVRRSLPAWSLLAGHLAIFVAIGCLDWPVLLLVGMTASFVVVFLCGSGLLFSALMKHSTSAVVLNLLTPLALWLALPLLVLLVGEAIGSKGGYMAEALLNNNPVVQVVVSTMGSFDYSVQYAGKGWTYDPKRFHWPDNHARTLEGTALRISGYTAFFWLCSGVQLLLARLALRRRTF